MKHLLKECSYINKKRALYRRKTKKEHICLNSIILNIKAQNTLSIRHNSDRRVASNE